MRSNLPPLRALQAFESFGRLASVNGAAQELGVTPGAISQQLKLLEDHLQMQLIMKDGRRASLVPKARSYHLVVSEGFEKLRRAQTLLAQQKSSLDINVSGLPTLLLKWLQPRLHSFEARSEGVSIRLEATHEEPEPAFLDHMFRLTYGKVSNVFPHARALFHDVCFPVCSPEFLKNNPEALEPSKLADLPWVDIDWGPSFTSVPKLGTWLAAQGLPQPTRKPTSIHSLSGSALESVVSGQGIALAQSSFASVDIGLGRLIRISQESIEMPEPYYVCWGAAMLEKEKPREFLNWLLAEAKNVNG
ncbi:glycine cleavage system transcriptional activator [Roseovarius sp. A-2]|uniref:LysR substrate-binding domain-containing protein n=1 Tax=Roseovarius sp. A-2 TaxID=1570360 RepID=UPI0009B5427F|nr:LysR substrate-binding domain-containing protein [Roseovarius sp. A-2]GAW35822.1 glycine cleavage system transcriptional activator [Roseovarius sp. A-2]